MGPNDFDRRFGGQRGESGAVAGATATTATDGAGGRLVGRRRFIEGALATGVALPGLARADGGGANVNVEFVDCVTVEITGDVGEITGLHFEVWNYVDVIDDHLTVEDLGSLTPGSTVFNALRVKEHDPGAGVLVLALNTSAYHHLYTADVYLDGPPDFFGDGADVSATNPTEAHVALTDLVQDDGTYGEGDVVTAEATLVNLDDRERTAFLGYSAVGPDGIAYTNGGTTGSTVTLAADETRTETVSWQVQPEAPDGSYDAHVAVWRESDPDGLQTRYDELYRHGAFDVGAAVAASIEGVSLPGGTFTDGEVVATDVTVENAGATDHTFFVGYSAIGPDGIAYTNGGTTGTAVTLAAGETDTVTVEWTVESGAPSGAYDVHVAVWAESDPDALETKLDEQIHGSTFEVA